MKLSLAVGLLMLIGKCSAWWITGSAAILSDALESIVHVVAVGFAAFSLWLSVRPATKRFNYGYQRISFFSAGFEGAMIIIAAVTIIAVSARKWMAGLSLEQLGLGTMIVAAAGGLNGALGWYLIHTGNKTGSLILVANGKHVLTDCWTSAGVVLGLLLVRWTGWLPFDPICAIALAVNILWSGGDLIFQSARGLLDYADPQTESKLETELDAAAASESVSWHRLKFRETGGRLLAEVHILFPSGVTVLLAHQAATRIEKWLEESFEGRLEVITHLEPGDDHDGIHGESHIELPAG
ncbi:MAG TPA: cation diffusion facilitator family transporter [Bryobacteraceae bacterium]|nr:cation diffusion facilitator family transporter [Bryobacteraceae bacterium]